MNECGMNQKAEEALLKSGFKKWEKIDPGIHLTSPHVRAGGLCYPVSYEGVKIALLFCSGDVEFINKEKWKKGWEFKLEWAGNEKYFYRYVGK